MKKKNSTRPTAKELFENFSIDELIRLQDDVDNAIWHNLTSAKQIPLSDVARIRHQAIRQKRGNIQVNDVTKKLKSGIEKTYSYLYLRTFHLSGKRKKDEKLGRLY